jgi:hypothetical protein|tara:strand:+ start:1713 stop:2486 length:774 start_codon:yes stop_codon:yes gene_type:complete
MSEDIKDFFASIPGEGDPEEATLNETTESSTEEKEGEAPSQQGDQEITDEQPEETEAEKPTPFHEHPRFKELTVSAREAKELAKERSLEVEELKQRLQQFDQKMDNISQSNQPLAVPKYWAGDEASYREFLSDRRNDIEQAKTAWKKELQQEQLQKQQEKQQADQLLEQGLDKLKSQHGEFNENKLLKVMDQYGIVDFDSAWEIYQLKESKTDKSKTASNKKVASATTTKSKGESTAPKLKTSSDLRGRSAFDFFNQ